MQAALALRDLRLDAGSRERLLDVLAREVGVIGVTRLIRTELSSTIAASRFWRAPSRSSASSELACASR